LARVVAPDAAAGLELLAGVGSGRLEGAILLLTGIGGGGDVDVHRAVGVDDEGMHRMVAGQRQTRNDGFGSLTRHDRTRGHLVAHDPIVDLYVEPVLVDTD